MPTPGRSLAIRIRSGLVLKDSDLEWHFVRSAGPGGQNVNKVSTAAQVRYDARRLLPPEVYARLRRIAGRRLARDGRLTVTARSARTQQRNRERALERLVDLLRLAAEPPTPRTATRPTAASRVRRLKQKRQRATVKGKRRRVTDLDE